MIHDRVASAVSMKNVAFSSALLISIIVFACAITYHVSLFLLHLPPSLPSYFILHNNNHTLHHNITIINSMIHCKTLLIIFNTYHLYILPNTSSYTYTHTHTHTLTHTHTHTQQTPNTTNKPHQPTRL